MKQSAWTFNQYKIQFEKGIKVVTTFLQKENHNISQSWEHKQFWGRAEMFQQQKMTGENVPWMVFAHQGRAAVTLLLCREWSHPGYRMWNEGRAGPRLCSVTLRWLHCFFFVNSLSNFTCVFLFSCRTVTGIPGDCSQAHLGTGNNSDLQKHSDCRGGRSHCKHTIIFVEKNTGYFWRATGTNCACLGSQLPQSMGYYFTCHCINPRKCVRNNIQVHDLCCVDKLHFQWSFMWNIHHQMVGFFSCFVKWPKKPSPCWAFSTKSTFLFFSAIWPFPVLFTINAANVRVSLELQ